MLIRPLLLRLVLIGDVHASSPTYFSLIYNSLAAVFSPVDLSSGPCQPPYVLNWLGAHFTLTILLRRGITLHQPAIAVLPATKRFNKSFSRFKSYVGSVAASANDHKHCSFIQRHRLKNVCCNTVFSSSRLEKSICTNVHILRSLHRCSELIFYCHRGLIEDFLLFLVYDSSLLLWRILVGVTTVQLDFILGVKRWSRFLLYELWL